jgi:hypothetical protein
MNPKKIEKVVGIDFGETYAAGVVCKDIGGYQEETGKLLYSGNVTNLTIKTKALNEPGRLYRKWLTEEKKRTFEYNQESKNIFELEELLKKVENEDFLVYFKR